MDLILYASRVYFKAFLTKKRSSSEYIVFALLIGYSIASLYMLMDKLENAEGGDGLQQLKLALLGGVLTIPLLVSFFPTYEQINQWVAMVYPVKKSKRYALHLMTEWISGGSFFVLAWTALLTGGSDQLSYLFFLQVCLCLQAGIVLRRVVHLIIEQKGRGSVKGMVLTVSSLACAGLLLTIFPIEAGNLQVSDVLVSLAILTAGFAIEEYLFEKQPAAAKTGKPVPLSTTLRLLWSKKSRSTLLMGILVKSLFLGFLTTKAQETDASSVNHIFYIFASPVFLFPYLFNNAWGFFPNYWYLHQSSQGTAKQIFNAYVRLLLPPLLLDFGITLIVFILYPLPFIPNVVAYVCSAGLFIPLGFWISLTLPQVVKQGSYMTKSNTNFGAGILMTILAATLSLVQVVDWYVYVLPLYALVGYGIYRSSLQGYAYRQERLFTTLYKDV